MHHLERILISSWKVERCYECKHNCSKSDFDENNELTFKQWRNDGKFTVHSEWWFINGKKTNSDELTSTKCCELSDFGEKIKYFHDKANELLDEINTIINKQDSNMLEEIQKNVVKKSDEYDKKEKK